MRHLFPILIAIASSPGDARAGGFETDGQSPAGTAMAGALTAVPGDAAAIFYNPAGLVLQPRGAALAGMSLATASTRLTTAGGLRADSIRQFAPLPLAYAFTPIVPRFAVGVGVFSRFGSRIAWPATVDGADGNKAPFPGRFLATATTLQTYTINPTVSFLATERIAFGAGLDVVLASVELRRGLALGDAEGEAHIGGTARAVGANLGVLAWIVPRRVSFGFTYRTAVSLDFNLRAHFQTPPELQSAVVDQTARANLPLPHDVTVGIAVQPIDRLTITADARLLLWSDLRVTAISFPMTNASPLIAPRQWHDSASLRMGIEYLLSQGLAIRAGWGYDRSPVPSTTLDPGIPAGDRFIASGGLGYTIPSGPARGLGIEAGYLAGIAGPRTSSSIDLRGATYAQIAHLFTAAISYRFFAIRPAQ